MLAKPLVHWLNPMIKFLISGFEIVFLFYVGDNVLLVEGRLRAKLTDFGSAGTFQVSYTMEIDHF